MYIPGYAMSFPMDSRQNNYCFEDTFGAYHEIGTYQGMGENKYILQGDRLNNTIVIHNPKKGIIIVDYGSRVIEMKKFDNVPIYANLTPEEIERFHP